MKSVSGIKKVEYMCILASTLKFQKALFQYSFQTLGYPSSLIREALHIGKIKEFLVTISHIESSAILKLAQLDGEQAALKNQVAEDVLESLGRLTFRAFKLYDLN